MNTVELISRPRRAGPEWSEREEGAVPVKSRKPSEVERLLTDLGAGRVTLEEVKADFAERQWPTRTVSKSPEEIIKQAANNEWDVPEPNSWVEVQVAKDRGVITPEQFTELSKVMAARAGKGQAAKK